MPKQLPNGETVGDRVGTSWGSCVAIKEDDDKEDNDKEDDYIKKKETLVRINNSCTEVKEQIKTYW